MSSLKTEFRPAATHIGQAADGTPFLQGTRCSTCGETFVGERVVCARCFARTGLVPVDLAPTGTVYTCSVVYRSFPGVKTPFVSAVVALDGGGNLQATIRDVPTDNAEALLGLPVRLVFEPTEQRDPAGIAFLAYYFSPASAFAGENA